MEDDQVSASALSTILSRRGFDVFHADSVAGAIARISDQPAFIVLDLMLPDGDGTTVLQAVRDRGLPSRVFVVTAVNDPDRLKAIESLKPEIVMQKPIDLPRMLSLMQPFH